MRCRRCAVAASVAMLLAGCAHRLELPTNFVAMDEPERGPYEVRGVSPDGVVIALRTRENPNKGALAFWSQAIRNELTGRGYKLVDSKPVESKAGTAGELLSFASEKGGRKFTYLLAVFVEGKEILLAEAGGPAEALTPHLAAIEKSLRTAE